MFIVKDCLELVMETGREAHTVIKSEMMPIFKKQS